MDAAINRPLKPFFIIWSGQAVSLLGSQLVQFALIWWLTETTGSATILAIASLAGLMPQVLLGPFIGVLVDRWNRRLIMLAADSTIALATIVLAYLYWVGSADIWHVLAILFVRAVAGLFHFSAMSASTSLMVPEAHLTRIQGMNQTLNGGLNIISAPLGALLLTVLPMQGILAIDVVTAAFAIGPLFFVAVPQPEHQANGDAGNGWASFWTDMREGFNYIKGWRGLLILTGMAMIVKILLNPAFALIPILVTDHFNGGAFQLSYMNAAWGIGVVIGGVGLSAWGGFKKRILTVLAGLIGLSFGLIVMGTTPSSLFSLAIGGVFISGLTVALIDGPLFAILQATIAPEMQGRVFTLFLSLVSSTVPIGLLIAGPVADLIGVRIWFVSAGLMTLVMSLAGFLSPAVLTIEQWRFAANGSPALATDEPPGSKPTAVAP